MFTLVLSLLVIPELHACKKEDIEQKIKDKHWKKEIVEVPDWPRKSSVAVFRPTVQHDCLGRISFTCWTSKYFQSPISTSANC